MAEELFWEQLGYLQGLRFREGAIKEQLQDDHSSDHKTGGPIYGLGQTGGARRGEVPHETGSAESAAPIDTAKENDAKRAQELCLRAGEIVLFAKVGFSHLHG